MVANRTSAANEKASGAYNLIINGRAVAGASTMPVINPANEQVIAQCPRADAAQLEQAIQAAKAAFPAWSKMPMDQRRARLMKIADDVEARAAELALLLTTEQGKPLPHAQMEVMGGVYFIRALGSFELPSKVLMENDTGKYIEHRTPLGVVAAIMPWNFPVSLFVVKAVPALLAGNTLVAKPAPTTPLVNLRLGEIFNAHLPPGVINVITDQNDLGGMLSSHPDIAKVSFTGSTATGKKVMGSASGSLKRVTLELGGNDAAIVLDDMDPKAAAQKLFEGSMANSGQICLAIKRAYVHESQYDAVCAELVKLAEQAVVDDGTVEGAQFGPIQNKMQYERVKAILEDAAKTGKVIAGGKAVDRPGYFIRPTIVRDIADDARLVREEQFGPVLPVLRYKDVSDAIARANDSEFGLGGTVWSSNPERALDVAKQIDSGIVWVNAHMAIDPSVSTGGSKQSGMGQELGVAGLEEFTQRHVVFVAKQ